jgi:hypothetical protein
MKSGFSGVCQARICSEVRAVGMVLVDVETLDCDFGRSVSDPGAIVVFLFGIDLSRIWLVSVSASPC